MVTHPWSPNHGHLSVVTRSWSPLHSLPAMVTKLWLPIHGHPFMVTYPWSPIHGHHLPPIVTHSLCLKGAPGAFPSLNFPKLPFPKLPQPFSLFPFHSSHAPTPPCSLSTTGAHGNSFMEGKHPWADAGAPPWHSGAVAVFPSSSKPG